MSMFCGRESWNDLRIQQETTGRWNLRIGPIFIPSRLIRDMAYIRCGGSLFDTRQPSELYNRRQVCQE